MSEETGNIRDEQGRFVPGVSGNLEGRPPDTVEQKIAKKAMKEIIADYKDKLADALPQISPVLIAKALEGDISAIKEIHDRVMDKPRQGMEIEHKIPQNLVDLIKHGTTNPNPSPDVPAENS